MAIEHMDPRAGGLARQAQWRERKAEQAERAEIVDRIIEPLARDNIGPELLRMALNLAQAASQAEVEVNNALERKQTAETAKILHTMARLEFGESTANTMTFAVPADRAASLARLRDRVMELDEEAGTSPTE